MPSGKPYKPQPGYRWSLWEQAQGQADWTLLIVWSKDFCTTTQAVLAKLQPQIKFMVCGPDSQPPIP